jgi:hypothetical protein
MADYGEGKCSQCGITFSKLSHNALVCSDRCRDEKSRERKHRRRKPVTYCPVCGAEAAVRNNRRYITCGLPSCQQENRRRNLQARYQGKPKVSTSAVLRKCNITHCGKEFLAPNRFTRTCPECASNRKSNTLGCDWWGGVI